MAALLVLAALAFAAVMFIVVLAGVFVSGLVRLILLPFFLLKWMLTVLVMLIVGPVLAIVGIALALAFGVVLAVPLLPILFVGLVVWLIARSSQRPLAA